jgi:hypothetical protein
MHIDAMIFLPYCYSFSTIFPGGWKREHKNITEDRIGKELFTFHKLPILSTVRCRKHKLRFVLSSSKSLFVFHKLFKFYFFYKKKYENFLLTLFVAEEFLEKFLVLNESKKIMKFAEARVTENLKSIFL